MSLEERVKTLQKKFHELPEEDYCLQTPKYQSLMKKYETLNKELEDAGYSEQEITDLYVDAEREYEEEDDDQDYALIIDQAKAEEILQNL